MAHENGPKWLTAYTEDGGLSCQYEHSLAIERRSKNLNVTRRRIDLLIRRVCDEVSDNIKKNQSLMRFIETTQSHMVTAEIGNSSVVVAYYLLLAVSITDCGR